MGTGFLTTDKGLSNVSACAIGRPASERSERARDFLGVCVGVVCVGGDCLPRLFEREGEPVRDS